MTKNALTGKYVDDLFILDVEILYISYSSISHWVINESNTSYCQIDLSLSRVSAVQNYKTGYETIKPIVCISTIKKAIAFAHSSFTFLLLFTFSLLTLTFR